jgi:hypothetical protein
MATVKYFYWQEDNVGYLFTDEWGDPEPDPPMMHDNMWLGYLESDPGYWRWSSTLDDLIVKLRDLYEHIAQAGGDVDAARTLGDYSRGLYLRRGHQVPPEEFRLGEFQTAD